MKPLFCIADDECDGKTVLFVLREKMAVSDATVRRAKPIENGITLDGARCKTNAVVRAGQRVGIVIDDAATGTTSSVRLESGALSIVYEDEYLIVLDKPALQAVHPGPGHESGTTANFLAHHLSKSGDASVPHPVQRLDRETSGLIVFAKCAHVQDALQRQLHTRAFERAYLAICPGTPTPAQGIVDAPIARISRGPSIFAIREDGKRAVSHYRVRSTWRIARENDEAQARDAESPENAPARETLSLVGLSLETGRTHQIRLHMQHLGCPLLGDAAYGSPSSLIGRAALHSHRISLRHPISGKVLELEAPLPPDMSRLVPAEGLAL